MSTADTVKEKICPLCERPFKKKGVHCPGCRTKIRRYRNKLAAVKMLGGKCGECGWIGPIAAYEFHHPNDDKDFDISVSIQKNWELVKKELEKCVLMCSNCHRIEHSNVTEKFLAEVEKYNGRNLDW